MSFGEVGNRFTFESWVRPTSVSAGSAEGEGGVVFVHRADCADFVLEWSGTVERNPGRFRFLVYPTAGCGSQVSVEAPVTSTVDVWHHVAGVFDGGQVRLFVDGQPAGSATLSLPVSWTERLLGHWAGRDGYDSRPIRGAIRAQIDEIRISRVARYAPAFPFTPPEHLDADASTVASWLFDEGTGTTPRRTAPRATSTGRSPARRGCRRRDDCRRAPRLNGVRLPRGRRGCRQRRGGP